MRIAEILSDVTSLRVCPPNAALALVNARPNSEHVASVASGADDQDLDLKRAKDLLELHMTVKLAHGHGVDKELLEARERVAQVLRQV